MNKDEIADIVEHILDYEFNDDPDKEEIMHLLLDSKVSRNINKGQKEGNGFGEKLSDSFAKGVGSWGFILSFSFILIVWITGNAILLSKAFDPYPFILLNLVLSSLAALQAPIIMMSQNRQESKDRLTSENDYRVNLKSEMISEDMHHKLVQIIENQEQIMTRLQSLEK